MVFNCTFRKSRVWGMTLVEIVVALGLSSLLLMTLSALYVYCVRSFAAMNNLIDLDNASRLAVDRLSQEVRQADRLLSFSTNELVFERSGQPVRFTFHPLSRVLVLNKGTDPEVLLRDCDLVQCEIFQRTPWEGAYGFFPAASVADCKVVRLTWTTSRQTGGLLRNQANLRSAQVVLRNQKL
jgi:hypothetical protein